MKSLYVALSGAVVCLALASNSANADGPVNPTAPYNVYVSNQLETTAGVCPAQVVIQGTEIVGPNVSPRSAAGKWSIAFSDGTATDKQPFQTNPQGIFVTPRSTKTITTPGTFTATFVLYDASGATVVAQSSNSLTVGCGGAATPTPMPPATWGVSVGAVMKSTTCPAVVTFSPQGISSPKRAETGQWELVFSDGTTSPKANFSTDASGAFLGPPVNHAFANGTAASATLTIWDASGTERATGASQPITISCSGSASTSPSGAPKLENVSLAKSLQTEVTPCGGPSATGVAAPCADLRFGRVTVGSLDVREGATIALLVPTTTSIHGLCSTPLSVVVNDVGTGAAEPPNGVTLEAYVDGKEAALSGGYRVKGGASFTVGPVDLMTPVGAHDVRLVIDPEHAVRDTDRTNTIRTFRYTLAKCGP